MKLLVVLSALLFTVSFTSSSKTSQSTERSGRLKITVFDTIDQIVPNITVVIQGNGIKRTFVSDEQVSHEFGLPAGVYTITSEEGYGYNYPFKRAPVRVEPDATSLINVLAPIRVLVIGTTVGTESQTRLAQEPKYETFIVPGSPAPELTLVVQYDQKLERGGILEYKDGARPNSGVTITYDVLTIVADVVRIDKETLEIEATGNVIIEDGKKRTHFQHKKIAFKNGRSIIED